MEFHNLFLSLYLKTTYWSFFFLLRIPRSRKFYSDNANKNKWPFYECYKQPSVSPLIKLILDVLRTTYIICIISASDFFNPCNPDFGMMTKILWTNFNLIIMTGQNCHWVLREISDTRSNESTNVIIFKIMGDTLTCSSPKQCFCLEFVCSKFGKKFLWQSRCSKSSHRHLFSKISVIAKWNEIKNSWSTFRLLGAI